MATPTIADAAPEDKKERSGVNRLRQMLKNLRGGKVVLKASSPARFAMSSRMLQVPRYAAEG
jgi:hypothetical protein